jgi:outer membrane protein insertion porin family
VSHSRARRRAPRIGAIGASLVAWVGGLGSVAAAAENARVAILPVVVHTAAPDAAYVSRGISDMLSARLEQLGGVEILRVDDPEAATTRLDPALERGRRVGADYVLYGSFTQFGDGASLDVQCAPVDPAIASQDRSIFIQSGSVGEIIPKLDRLADMVARYVGGVEGSEGEGGAPAAAAPDAALEELRQRLEALERAVFTPVAGAAPESQPEPAPPDS